MINITSGDRWSVSTKREESALSNSAFYHKDSKISLGMRCTLAIMERHFGDGLKVASVGCAARQLTNLLDNPGKIDPYHERRCKKMRGAIEVAISRGFLRFSHDEGGLVLTSKGRHVLKSRRKKLRRRRPNRYGPAPRLATS